MMSLVSNKLALITESGVLYFEHEQIREKEEENKKTIFIVRSSNVKFLLGIPPGYKVLTTYSDVHKAGGREAIYTFTYNLVENKFAI